MFLLKTAWIKKFLCLFGILNLLLATNACSEDFDIEKENKKREKILLEKIEKNIKLTYSEINNLSGILLWDHKYNKGIDILERLKDSEDYNNKKYVIYFSLALFYTEKVKETINKQKKLQLIEQAEEYLTLGFSSTPEEALAYLLRAKGYAVMGCRERAKADIQKAIEAAKSKEIIFFEDGIYLDRERFIQTVNRDLNWIKDYKEDCILDNSK